MANPFNQLAKILPSSWEEAAVHYSKLTDAVNTLLGYNGPAVISNSLDVQNNNVQNVANPVVGTDALNLQTAEGKYAPSVQSAALDVNGSSPIKGLSYLYMTAPKFADAEVPVGTINGSNKVFTLAQTPKPAGSLMLTLLPSAGSPPGAYVQYGGGVHYTLLRNQITMVTAPATGSTLICWYRY